MKKTRLMVLLLLTASSLAFSQDNVGIGTGNPSASAVLDLSPPNKDKGLLIPRLKTSERDGISNPAESLLIFNMESQCYEGYDTDKNKWVSVGCLGAPSTSPNPPSVCDGDLTDTRDNNTYKTVQIGDQCWMAENLKYLPEVHSNIQFKTQGEAGKPGYGVHGYDDNDVTAAKSQVNYSTYGVYYNWVAVMQGATSSIANPSGVQGVCPENWHVPSDAEWKQMEIYLGMDPIDANEGGFRTTGGVGTKLKASTLGFMPLFGDKRNANGTFGVVGSIGYWWTASESGTHAFFRYLSSGNIGVNRNVLVKANGYSLRCVKD